MNASAHVIRPSSWWRQYYARNAASLMSIPWTSTQRLSPEQRDSIASSVQEFQLGESSEGRQLLARGRAYARLSGDEDYADALAAFIAEEHRHARELKRFMQIEGIEPIGHAWPDTVFRWLRHRAGLELSILVLLSAEIIAKVYYVALRDATDSPILRRLCEQILRDEEAHVVFQCERVAILRRHRARWVIAIQDWLHRILMAGTCLVVWHKHARALRAGGFGFIRFLQQAWRERTEASRLMNPALVNFEQFDSPAYDSYAERERTVTVLSS